MQKNLNVIHEKTLSNLSITMFNEMQSEVIEKAETSKNIMVIAPTGSGKTLSFLIPILTNLSTDKKGVQALIVAPSRELSLQIEQVFKSMKTNFKVSCCYGGHSFKIEQNSLSEAPAVIIGTPGRLADHIERKSFDPSTIETVVLDEFDKSLQMGFHEQLKVIFFALNKSQKHILTSATRLEELPNFLPFLSVETLDYQHQEVESKLKLNLVKTKSTEKVETLMRLIAGFNQEVCLIFCNHKDAVNRISGVLDKYTFAHGVFHGDLEQIDREKNLIKFRGGACNVLISTDLAARGLDIPEIKHVVHYQMPVHYEEFVHRNGRTARMHADGEAYLVLAEDETLPIYMHKKDFKEITLPEKLTLPAPPTFVCLYISAGKKDKISKGDIAGLLMKKGELTNEDLGLINILDHSSYVSVNRNKLKVLLLKLKNEKLKKIKVKIEEAS
jgi:superfamily II DNA/RNA helicase